MLLLYIDFAKIVNQSYTDVASVVDITVERLRLQVIDGSMIDIRYPVLDKFSFHWMRAGLIYRVDTAPHHLDLVTAPRHVHYARELDVREDFITGNIDIPTERFKSFLNWVRTMI